MGSNLEVLTDSRQVNEEDEDQLTMKALWMINCVTFPMVLNSALELGLIDVIYGDGNGKLVSTSEIIDKLPRKPRNLQEAPALLDRILRYLTTYSMLSCHEADNGQTIERLYGAKPICKFFLKNNQDSVSFVPLHLLHQNKYYLDSWGHLSDAILEGRVPFEGAHGMLHFEYAAKDERFNMMFNEALSNHTTLIMKKLLKVYKGFEGVGVLVDVGGGTGINASIITEMYPNIRAICYDLPHVIATAPSYPGVEYVGGDMFVSVPKGDAIFMKTMLHDWSDEHCLKMLKNCYDALPEHGKVISVEPILDVAPKNVASKINADLDLLMLCLFKGGKERTLKELEDLATRCGFRSCRLSCSVYNLGLLEFHKA